MALALLVIAGVTACGSGPADDAPSTDRRIGVTLVTKDSTNPYFVAMQKGARTAAATAGVRLTVTSGRDDAAGQVGAVQAAIGRGDRGILITPASDEVDGALTTARLAGLYVIALDTPPDRRDVVDITFASDDHEAGRLLGAWVAGQLGGRAADVALLDLDEDRAVPTDRERDRGFLDGLGNGRGDGYRIACRQPSGGTEDGGRRAMETCLGAKAPVGVVYAADVPTALGAAAALRAAGVTDAVVVTADGGCAGVAAVRDGTLGATVLQDPVRMAELGVGAIAKIARGGVKPSTTPGKSFHDTGVRLVTSRPVPGVASIDPGTALGSCWGDGGPS